MSNRMGTAEQGRVSGVEYLISGVRHVRLMSL